MRFSDWTRDFWFHFSSLYNHRGVKADHWCYEVGNSNVQNLCENGLCYIFQDLCVCGCVCLCACVLPSRVKPKTAKQPDVQSLEFSPIYPPWGQHHALLNSHTNTANSIWFSPSLLLLQYFPLASRLSLFTTCRNTLTFLFICLHPPLLWICSLHLLSEMPSPSSFPCLFTGETQKDWQKDRWKGKTAVQPRDTFVCVNAGWEGGIGVYTGSDL